MYFDLSQIHKNNQAAAETGLQGLFRYLSDNSLFIKYI